MSEKRILFLTTSIGTGGVGNQLYNISTNLQHHGYKIKIISLRPVGRFGEKTAASGIDVQTIGLKNKLMAPLALYKIRQAIQSYEPHIVHTHLFHATILGRIAAVETGASTITTVHSTYEKERKEHETTIRDHLYSTTDGFCDLTTFVGKVARDRYIRVGAVPKEKAVHVYNGVDTDYFYPNAIENNRNGKFEWIIVGNLLKHKGHKSLLQALYLLSKRDHKFHLYIVGGGELEEELKQIASDLCITNHVTFEGRVFPREVPNYLRSADGFVLSSLREGFGLVVAEAMACELPVVATNTGGPSEIVDDGKTGFLVEKGSPKDLADKMQKVMDLPPEDRDVFGKYGRQRIKDHYSLEQTVSEWIDIYEQYS
ncbi:glycosyltransferase family 4 protein [Halorubraceae archaeon YAN]|nr:glycosyltransferase family 4 protein [Halorubraceae archaeon YAN]